MGSTGLDKMKADKQGNAGPGIDIIGAVDPSIIGGIQQNTEVPDGVVFEVTTKQPLPAPLAHALFRRLPSRATTLARVLARRSAPPSPAPRIGGATQTASIGDALSPPAPISACPGAACAVAAAARRHRPTVGSRARSACRARRRRAWAQSTSSTSSRSA